MKKYITQKIQKIHLRSFSQTNIEAISQNIVKDIIEGTYLFIDMSKFSQDCDCIEIIGYSEDQNSITDK